MSPNILFYIYEIFDKKYSNGRFGHFGNSSAKEVFLVADIRLVMYMLIVMYIKAKQCDEMWKKCTIWMQYKTMRTRNKNETFLTLSRLFHRIWNAINHVPAAQCVKGTFQLIVRSSTLVRSFIWNDEIRTIYVYKLAKHRISRATFFKRTCNIYHLQPPATILNLYRVYKTCIWIAFSYASRQTSRFHDDIM